MTVYPPPPQSRPKLAFDLKPPTKSIAFLSLPFSFSELLKFNVTQEKVRLQSFSFFDNQRNFFEAFFLRAKLEKPLRARYSGLICGFVIYQPRLKEQLGLT